MNLVRVHLEALGYSNVRFIDELICGILPQIYTVGVFYGLTIEGSEGHFCFDTEQNAVLFLADWDGKTQPVVGVDGCKAIK